MGKIGFRLVIAKPKARLSFAAPTRVRPGKKGVGAPCQDTQVMPGEWFGIKGQTRLGRGLSGTCP